MNEKLYPQGFIFSNSVVESLPEHFTYRKILENYYYYYDVNSHFLIHHDDNYFILIHGEFQHIGLKENLSQNEVIKTLFDTFYSNYIEFLKLIDFIAGRYVIIIGDRENVRIFPDATNSRSTYFIEDKIAISSHANLIADSFQLGHSNVLTNFHNTLLNTPIKNTKSIIPNFSVDLPSGKFERFFPRERNKYTNIDEDKKFNLIEKFWKNQIENVFSKSDNVFLTLTGGGDSRMSLSLSFEYLDKLMLTTYAYTDSEKVDESDITSKVLSLDNMIVKNIVKYLRLNHRFLYFDQNESKLNEKVKEVVKKNTIAIHSPFFIPFIEKHFEQKNLIHIRANLLEIGQAYYFRNYKESTVENLRKRFLFKNKAFIKDENTKSKAIHMFNDFADKLNYSENTYDYHLLDLMYWEIHMGRWHCEILNTHDYVVETVSPYNHRALIDITLSFDYEKRKNRYFQYELINRNFPVLNFFGMNEAENLYEQTVKKNIT